MKAIAAREDFFRLRLVGILGRFSLGSSTTEYVGSTDCTSRSGSYVVVRVIGDGVIISLKWPNRSYDGNLSKSDSY